MYRNFDVEIKKRRIEGGDLCKDKKRYTLTDILIRTTNVTVDNF